MQCHAIQLDDDKDDLLDDATGFAVEGAGDDEYTDYVANNLAALTDSPDLLDEQFACNRPQRDGSSWFGKACKGLAVGGALAGAALLASLSRRR